MGVWVTGVYIVVVLPVLLFYRSLHSSLLQLLILENWNRTFQHNKTIRNNKSSSFGLCFEEDKLLLIKLFYRSLDREEEYVHASPDPESEGRKERSVV